MVARYAVVCDGQVINVCLWDGKTEWTPDDDCTVHPLPEDSPVGPGWTRSGNNRWVAPTEIASVPEQVGLTVDPALLAAFFQTVQDPNSDPRAAIEALAEALNTATG